MAFFAALRSRAFTASFSMRGYRSLWSCAAPQATSRFLLDPLLASSLRLPSLPERLKLEHMREKLPLSLPVPAAESDHIPMDCANRSPLGRVPKPANKGARPRCVVMKKLRKRARTGR
eukprot:TRINITY_DN1192_c1_g4_i1.p1 TRINITY_DN1192_c1_g4~~TRINITY_DN1192_c1_g4_i1.p1  ORF type:complete len:118 (-),score=15.48 TRINITY_DN1192_c1_g4_i1:87-440(-)